MLFGYLRTAFPDLHVRIDEQVAEGEKVVTRKTFLGTHGGEFMGVPATARPVAFEVIDILTVRDGRISEHRVVFDQLSIRQQLTA
jgi:predicted ester cyclase